MPIWRACFQNLLHPPRHVTHLHYWLPFAIQSSSLIKYVPIVGYFHLTLCTMFTKWLKVGMSDMQWTEEVLEPIKTLFLCFSLCMFKFYESQNAVLTIVEFEIFDIFSSKFQLVSVFSLCSNFCVENWLLCCDLICKWVTCRSGCKRFWKSALHVQLRPSFRIIEKSEREVAKGYTIIHDDNNK